MWYDSERSLEGGELVTVHGRVSFGDSQWLVIYIFRVQDHKIVQAREASQKVLEDLPNENGIF